MLETLHPVRQHAHNLIERLTPEQLSAIVDLLDAAANTQSKLIPAPFSDEPEDDAEACDGMLGSLDSDFWPAAGRRLPS